HELHDALLTLIVLPPQEEWRHFYDILERNRRAFTLEGKWAAAEKIDIAKSLPEEASMVATLRGWMGSIGPVTPSALAAKLGLPVDAVEAGLAKLESEGLILRGRFRSEENEFCHRRILARIHRMTLGRLRKEIEPVSAADYMRFIGRWQH